MRINKLLKAITSYFAQTPRQEHTEGEEALTIQSYLDLIEVVSTDLFCVQIVCFRTIYSIVREGIK